ncbi:hypothetical protein D9613_012250 [Agrocybe pediades]|uniref:Uncharacterized protein n=1 Tax=Agrocybe pediades TaxID=84607 RepID=A0A8H4VHP5_9AGAR|nr:hypothetical protein D9613_012250 [Agrocybe pediades]
MASLYISGYSQDLVYADSIPASVTATPRHVLTLDLARMSEVRQPTLDLSNLKSYNIRFPSLDSRQPLETTFGDPLPVMQNADGGVTSFVFYKAARDAGSLLRGKFPPDAKGVFYFHKSDPQISSSVRFRICDDPKPSTFNAGHDLLLPPTYHGDNSPWKISLLSIASKKGYRGFQQMLLDEGLVDRSVMERLRNLASEHEWRIAKLPLYSIDQPFIADLSQRVSIHFVSLKGLVSCKQLPSLQVSWHKQEGKVRVRFVLSPLPKHRDHPSLLLEYLEILTPIKRLDEKDAIKMPVVGEYLKRKGKVWSYSLKDQAEGRKIADIFDIPI